MSRTAIDGRIAAQKALLQEVRAVDPGPLSAEQQIDRALMVGQLEGTIFEQETLRPWEQNPELYLQYGSLAGLIDQPGDAAEKGRRVAARLRAVTALLTEARKNLRKPPKRFTEGGIYQAAEWRTFLETDVAAFAARAGAASDEVKRANDDAIAALQGFERFLKVDLLPVSTGEFAIGREHYEFILEKRWYMTDNAAAILAKGQKAFADTEAQLTEVAGRMKPGASWVDVYESLKDDHPPIDRIKGEYQAQMEAAQAFLTAHDIVTLPPGERVITIDTPPAMRRSSPFGTFSSVGPFDKELLGKLVLTPIEDSLSPEQRKERLRSHHRAWIPIIAVHEAYPGHHVAALKANENPRVLRRLVRESIFSEGWGLYCEELMFEQGFLKGDDVRLTQLRNRLWRAARVIIDVGLHTGTMTFDQGVQLLVDKVRFERYAAELEVGMYARRPTMVLGYLIGMMEIADMRAAYEKKFGKPAKPKVFFDKLLRIGSLPPSLVRAELLGETSRVDPSRCHAARRGARGSRPVAIRLARAPDRRRDQARRSLRVQRRPIRATVAQPRRAVHFATRAGARRHVHDREREDSPAGRSRTHRQSRQRRRQSRRAPIVRTSSRWRVRPIGSCSRSGAARCRSSSASGRARDGSSRCPRAHSRSSTAISSWSSRTAHGRSPAPEGPRSRRRGCS